MLAVILSACLASDPAVCRDFKIPLSVQVDPGRCLMDAPPYFAQWATEHPMWTIKRWRCAAVTEDDI